MKEILLFMDEKDYEIIYKKKKESGLTWRDFILKLIEENEKKDKKTNL